MSDPRSTRRGSTRAVAALLLVTGPCLVACGDGGNASPDASASAAQPSGGTAADHFLDTYVTDDGRVPRLDQGGDIVSEGQAYGMLIAEVAGREELVTTIWDWTKQHLLRPDGLLSFHASADGSVIGPDPAADADVLAAYALLRYDGPGAASVQRDGEALAQSVLDHELVDDPQGRPVLTAGTWAVESSILNPSYLMPGVFEDLATLTGDQAWLQLAASSTALLDTVTDAGRLLPPDWARLDGQQGLVPVADAAGDPGDAQYGPDAQRVPLWFAYSCTDEAHRLAGQWWAILQEDDRSSALALTTTGAAKDSAGHPLPLLAAGAAAAAAGDTRGAADLNRGAAEAAQGTPTYYGDAWVALAEALREGRIAACD